MRSLASSPPETLLELLQQVGYGERLLLIARHVVITWPSCIMIRRLPRRMASFMLCVTMSVVRWFSSTHLPRSG